MGKFNYLAFIGLILASCEFSQLCFVSLALLVVSCFITKKLENLSCSVDREMREACEASKVVH